MKVAIKEGRFKPEDAPVLKRRRGMSRVQTLLVPAPPPYNHDLRSVFVIVSSAAYIKFLAPSPVKGTLAAIAVLGYFNTPKVCAKLLGSVKTQLYRLTNRPLLTKSCTVLHAFIHTGTSDEQKRKLELFRDLGGEFADDVEKEMAFRIVETLVTFSRGKPPNDENKRGFYPYSKPAGHVTTNTHTHTHTHTHTQTT